MKENKGVREWLRKRVVALKRKPQKIALFAYLLTFLYYSLNLTSISNTTAKIQGKGMGLCGFATMLFSILSLVCFINSFPHRKKVNKPMLVLLFLMSLLVIFCDYRYRALIYAAVFRPENPIVVNQSTAYIAQAASVLSNHIVFLIISVLLVALLPIYSKLLRKINTSIEIEGYDNMTSIDISGDN